jgi:predicted permease
VAVVVAIVGVVIGLLLLLACVNAANLLLASTLSRAREMGVRLAVGASRPRIVRQLLTESLSLGLAAGATGLLMTVWLVPALVVFVRLPIEVDAAPDWLVYSFLVAMSLLSGLGAGLAPVRRVLRDDLASPLKGLGARSDGSAPRPRLRTALVGVQAAASIMLLVLAALLTRGMVRATEVDIGFDADRLLVISPAFGREDDDNVRARAYWDVALPRVRGVAGVQAVSLAEYPPFGGGHHVQILNRPGGPYTIYHNKTQADYFATLGLRTIRGRAYTLQEVAGHVQVAVISDALARDFFPGEDPVGQSLDRIDVGSRRTIIGVVSNALTSRLRELNAAAIYQPLEDPRPASLVVRTEGPPQNLTQSLRSALQPLDPGLRLDIRPVSDGLQDELDQPRMLAMLAGTLAAIALGLALVGTYGVTAFVVGQRRQEIGIRIALGATVRDIMRLLLGDSMRPVVVGLAAGMSSALLGSRVLSGVLYGVPSSDPLAFGASALVLLAAAATAVIEPTRRASRLDPASVLREG